MTDIQKPSVEPEVIICPGCDGHGKVVVDLRYHSEKVGWQDVLGTCPQCEGSGRITDYGTERP